jgi:glycosyltransferase involved in cell wall biosynthesis
MAAQPTTRAPFAPGTSRPGGSTADLVVLSHLRWTWVWQRPQHLVSRFARRRARAGARTWFVEEPALGDVTTPRLATADVGSGVTRVWLVLPQSTPHRGHLGFDAAPGYARMLVELLARQGVEAPEVLLYTPMALDLAESLSPSRLFYDVMDDLASFKGAPDGLLLRHRRVLTEADLVVAGGRSLYNGVVEHVSGPCLLAPSGVETSHFAAARRLRTPHERPVAGYVGVIDERVDLELVGRLAAELPDWTLRIVGPVTKIDPADLPRADTIEYPGMTAYDHLPAVLAGFDVALMPFALNAATRSISPTKTLEYLAAGLPVVSTRVPDVVADYDGVVHLADDGASFAAACRSALHERGDDRDRRARSIARRHEWDTIAERLAWAMADAGSPASVVTGARA